MAVVDEPTTWYEDIVDGVGKFEPLLLECVRDELRSLASGKGRKARTARVALNIAKEFKLAKCGGANVDDEIVSASASLGALVATVDSDLARAAKASHIQVISMRRGRVALGRT